MDEDPSTFLFDLFVIGICIVFSAFFSGMEIAFVSSDKTRLKNKYLKLLSKNSSKFIVSMVVGNNVSLVIYSIYTSKFIGGWVAHLKIFSAYPLVLVFVKTIISTFFILLFAEFIPKVFFNLYAHQVLKKMGGIASFFYGILYVPTLLITVISNAIFRVFNQVSKQQSFFKQYNRANALKGENTPLKNFKPFAMKHLQKDVILVNLNATPERINALKNIKNDSKILVYKKTKTNIVGYIKPVQIFKMPQKVANILLPVVKIEHNESIKNTLSLMKANKNAVALIYDENEKFCGILKKNAVIQMFLEI